MKERTCSQYDYEKVKFPLSVAKHTRDRFLTVAKMYGVSAGFLFQLLTDELYYEPLQPKLPERLESASNKVHTFFAKRKPEWVGRNVLEV